jgi:hypothetical protein
MDRLHGRTPCQPSMPASTRSDRLRATRSSQPGTACAVVLIGFQNLDVSSPAVRRLFPPCIASSSEALAAVYCAQVPCSLSISLPPFAPSPLRPFIAPMEALTSVQRLAPRCSAQISSLHVSGLHDRSVTNHPAAIRHRFDTLPFQRVGLPVTVDRSGLRH